MNIKRTFFIICLFSGLLFLSIITSARVGPTYAIVNCKIMPVSGPPVEKGIIIIRDGLIETLGPKDKIAIPEDAEVIEADGLFAYPGLVDAHVNLFLDPAKEKSLKSGPGGTSSTQSQESKMPQRPDLMAFDLLKIKSSVINDFHRIGVTTVLVAPKNGIYAGQSVLLNLIGKKSESMVLQNPVALHVNFVSERGAYPSSLMGTMAYLRQSFLDAERYSSWKTRFSKSSGGIKRPEYSPFLESLVPYVVQKKPIFFNCANQEDIKRALRLIKEFKLNGFLSNANEGWRVAGLFKKETPLLVSLNFKPPFTSIYSTQGEELKKKGEGKIYPANAANLNKQGVKFALTSLGLKKCKDFAKNIQKAIEMGLPREEALKALTLIPAEFLGVSHCIGSLESGKIANIILTSGEIFEKETKVKRVFVDGVSFKIKQPPKEEKPPAKEKNQ